ncbi:hypothetical protein JCM4814A_41500 [Streptomyces phaeofaciens JCM 4814]|uniref:Uncharacterized protein n=1 Tax=Streptomyces phaeofaciens TaxID=68254 RepID=A0A918LZR6_9ACTN|nr:hypothetical protein [Streptomyces phaeofaciens]GGT80977.1 hypothetical protein GCM10010226_69550 [Streptomyces phaeofaciens]
MNNLAAALVQSARAGGDRVAVRQDETVLTQREIVVVERTATRDAGGQEPVS